MATKEDNAVRLVEGLADIVKSKADVLEGRKWLDRVAWRRSFKKAWLIKMKGGMFVEWQTGPAPSGIKSDEKVIFVWDMGIGCFERPAQPTGEFSIEIDGRNIISFCSTTVSRTWKRDGCRFHFEVKLRDKKSVYGLGYLLVPAGHLKPSVPARIRVSASNTMSDRWFMLCQYGEGCLDTGLSFQEPNAASAYVEEGIEAILAGPQRLDCDGFNLYWGDLHVHSTMANYLEHSPDENYEYGRYVSQLDFMAITDQDHFLTEKTFSIAQKSANDYYMPGEFVTFIGYEWSSRLFGHRNVIFRGDKGILIRRHDVERPFEPPYAVETRDSFQALCRGLKAFPEKSMLVPHHPSMCSMGALDWAIFDSKLEMAVEIYSLWGSSEYKGAPGRSKANDQRTGSYVQDALARGYRLGIIASGESGDGHPGNTQWRRNYADKAGLAMTPLGGGLAAVWAKKLTRESIFDAIKARRCYGTTNARIGLKFKANGMWMGEKIVVREDDLKRGLPVNLNIWVRGTDEIDGIHIFRNGTVADYTVGHGDRAHYQHTDVLAPEDCLQVEDKRFAYYYVRVCQKDGHMAWSSPIWVWLKN